MADDFLHLLQRLNERLTELAGMAEWSVQNAITAVDRRDAKLANQVIARDEKIDQEEIAIEDECLNLLALFQPVAADLRFVICVMKMNSDLERIADHAVNIAKYAILLADLPDNDGPSLDLPAQSRRVRAMLKESLDVLLTRDVARARSVQRADEEVDQFHANLSEMVEDRLQQHPSEAPRLLRLLNISRDLERIADHSVNISEDIIYLLTGEIVRHRPLPEELESGS